MTARTGAALLALTLASAPLWAQAGIRVPTLLDQPEPSVEEQQSLMNALSEGNTSPMDLVRALEGHLERYPKSVQRAELELSLARAAIDSNDTPRIVKYGVPALMNAPDDVRLLLLDRVALALLITGGDENADRAYEYARQFEDIVDGLEVAPGPDAARRQEERERALGRVLLYQSRARSMTREPEEAIRLATRAFAAFPNEESAREWAQALFAAGRREEAITHLAEAFSIPDIRVTESTRLDDRLLLGQWYSALHGSEAGLGDIILAAYDRTSTLVETRRKKLLALDPNAALADPLEFTLTGLDGGRFRLSSLKGNIIVLDFWATWCAPCRAQHPLYEDLKKKFPESRGVVFLAIDADEDHGVVRPFLEEMMWDKNVYFEDGLARLLNVTNIPTTILFDRQGRMVSRMDGFNPETFLDLMTARIEALLEAPQPAQP
jgi:thiol-disulfide isomerase/thioredoxin